MHGLKKYYLEITVCNNSTRNDPGSFCYPQKYIITTLLTTEGWELFRTFVNELLIDSNAL